MKSVRGFGIVQVLMATAMLGILSVATIKLINNSAKGQKSVQNAMDYDVLKASINQVLATPVLCKNGLLNSSGAVAQFGPSVTALNGFSELKIGTRPIAKINQNIGGGLTISKLELVDSGAGGFISGIEVIYLAELVVEVTKATGSYGGITLSNASNPFRIKITTNSTTNQITECDSLGGAGLALTEAQMCASLGGVWNPAGSPKCSRIGAVASTPDLDMIILSCGALRYPYPGPGNIYWDASNYCAKKCSPGKKVWSPSVQVTGFGGILSTGDGIRCAGGGVRGSFGSSCSAVCF